MHLPLALAKRVPLLLAAECRVRRPGPGDHRAKLQWDVRCTSTRRPLLAVKQNDAAAQQHRMTTTHLDDRDECVVVFVNRLPVAARAAQMKGWWLSWQNASHGGTVHASSGAN